MGREEKTGDQRKAASLKIQIVFESLQKAGRYIGEVGFGTWGKNVRTVLYENNKSNIFDLVNMNFDLEKDTVQPTLGGPIKIAIPKRLLGKTIKAQFFDADSKKFQAVEAKQLTTSTIQIEVPAFRVYGSLLLSQ